MPKTKNNALTVKERLFTEEYPIDLNGTQAAIRAGYSPRTAGQMASRLLTKVNIQEGIQESFRLRSIRTEISQDLVLKELATIAFADMAVYVKSIPKNEAKSNLAKTLFFWKQREIRMRVKPMCFPHIDESFFQPRGLAT